MTTFLLNILMIWSSSLCLASYFFVAVQTLEAETRVLYDVKRALLSLLSAKTVILRSAFSCIDRSASAAATLLDCEVVNHGDEFYEKENSPCMTGRNPSQFIHTVTNESL